jgi:hypothetical protein
MKKTLAILLVGLLGLSNLFAQYQMSPEFIPVLNDRSVMEQDDIVLGYCDPEGDLNGIGGQSVMDLGAAIKLDKASFGIYKGSSIKAINVAFADNVTDVSIFIKNSLNGANLHLQTVGSKATGWHTIELDQSFVFPDEDFYIGYTARGKFGMAFSGETDSRGCWLYEGNNNWRDYSGQDWGSACIMAVIDGSSFTKTDIGFESIKKSYTKINESFNVSGIICNNSSSVLHSFKVEYKINDGSAIEKTASCNIAPGAKGVFTFEANPIPNAGVYSISLSLDADDNLDNNTITGTVEAFKYTYPKRVVVEEGTGTWCGWCPRGAVGLASMKEKYPDSFIGIAVHTSVQGGPDPMNIPGYGSALGFSGYPSSKVNRKIEADPGFESLESFYLEEMGISSQIGVDLNADLDLTTNTVNIVTTITYGYDASDVNCRLVYVLTENDVTGYTQTNYYAKGQQGQNLPMGEWNNRPAVASVAFEDVARGIYSSFTGIANSIPTTVEENVPFTHEYTITLPNTIQDKDQLELVVMIIDVKSGEIINADKVHLTNGDSVDNIVNASGILNFASAKDNTLYVGVNATGNITIDLYDLNGRRIASSIGNVNGTETVTMNTFGLKGVYIVKVSTNEGIATEKILL